VRCFKETRQSNIIGGTFFFNVYAIRVILIIHSVLFTAHRFIKSSLLEKEKEKHKTPCWWAMSLIILSSYIFPTFRNVAKLNLVPRDSFIHQTVENSLSENIFVFVRGWPNVFTYMNYWQETSYLIFPLEIFCLWW